MRRLPPYRVLYNNDTTNIGGCLSPWRAKGESFSDERVVASIEEAAHGGADCVVLAPGLGWIPWWKSAFYPDHYQWWMAKTGLQPDQYGRYMLEGGDLIATHLAACRRLGIGCFVSLRINDVHLQEHYLEKDPRSIFVCRFYEEHLHLLIDPEHKRVTNYYHRRGLDWGHAEVRAYKLGLAREMAAYDVDGFELDCLRDHTLFSDAVPLAERARLLTAFAADVRAALDAGRPGRWLSMRIPLDPARHAESGIDVALLSAAGVDIFNVSAWFNTDQRTDGIRHVRQHAPAAAAYGEITHSTARHVYFANRIYGNIGSPRASDHQLYTSAQLALQAGAHGISVFNFAYYRHIESHGEADGIVCEPPFHILRHLSDSRWLARHPGHYHLGNTMYLCQLPRELRPGVTETFHLEIAEHVHATSARARIHALQPFAEGALDANLNGDVLTPTPGNHRFFGNPFDGMISPAGHRRAFTIGVGSLRAGVNQLHVTWHGAEAIQLIFIDLGVDLVAVEDKPPALATALSASSPSGSSRLLHSLAQQSKQASG